ncbi:MAG: tail fiber protein [bacterium]|nr:tail fiber protein [bacterium]
MNLEDVIGSVVMSAGTAGEETDSHRYCLGQLVSIAECPEYALLVNTTFGGDGRDTVGTPDLRTRTPVGVGESLFGTTYNLGDWGGEQIRSVKLSADEMPGHSHPASFNTSDLNGAIQTTAPVDPVPIRATLRCSNNAGATSNSPRNAYPGVPGDPGVDTWASVQDGHLNADVLVDGRVSALDVETNFDFEAINVDVAATGSGEPYLVETALPVAGVRYFVVVKGIVPPKSGMEPK